MNVQNAGTTFQEAEDYGGRLRILITSSMMGYQLPDLKGGLMIFMVMIMMICNTCDSVHKLNLLGALLTIYITYKCRHPYLPYSHKQDNTLQLLIHEYIKMCVWTF